MWRWAVLALLIAYGIPMALGALAPNACDDDGMGFGAFVILCYALIYMAAQVSAVVGIALLLMKRWHAALVAFILPAAASLLYLSPAFLYWLHHLLLHEQLAC